MAVETIANKLQGYIKNAFRFSVLYFFSIITLILKLCNSIFLLHII